MYTVSVGGPTQHRWGQTFTHRNLLVVIELANDEHVSEIGHEILLTIQDRYDELQPKTLPQIELLIKTLDLPSNSTIVLGCIVGDILYVTGRGQGTVYLYRNNQWAPVFVNYQSISGPLDTDDRIFLCTPALIRSISEETLAELAQPEELNDIEEDIAALLHQSDYADGAACLIVQHSPLETGGTYQSPITSEEVVPSTPEHQEKPLFGN